MSELMISRAFVKKLASNIRVTYGKEVKHTDAIELVAGSLGWKGDALMHLLKQAEVARCDKPVDALEPLAVAPNSVVIDDKFQNTELLKSFFYEVVHGNPKQAEQYAALISEQNAWCRLALAFHYKAKYQSYSKTSDDEYMAEVHLIKAFKMDAETIKFVAQIVGMSFVPSTDASDVIMKTNLKDDPFGNDSGRFQRGDLMAWATFIAREWGFLSNSETGLIVQSKPRFENTKFKFDSDDEKMSFITHHYNHFWDYLVDEIEGTAEEKVFLDRLNRLKSGFYGAIAVLEGRAHEAGKKPIGAKEALDLLKPEGLVAMANGTLFEGGHRAKAVDDVIKEITGVSVLNGQSLDDVLNDRVAREPLEAFYKHLQNRFGPKLIQ